MQRKQGSCDNKPHKEPGREATVAACFCGFATTRVQSSWLCRSFPPNQKIELPSYAGYLCFNASLLAGYFMFNVVISSYAYCLPHNWCVTNISLLLYSTSSICISLLLVLLANLMSKVRISLWHKHKHKIVRTHTTQAVLCACVKWERNAAGISAAIHKHQPPSCFCII